MKTVTIKNDCIKLGQAMKLAGMVSSGLEAKLVIQDGKVKVNDPFSQKNSDKIWKYSKIKDQIKSLWVYKID